MSTDKDQFILAMHHYELCKYCPKKPFKLVSGINSPWYFNIKAALLLDYTKSIISRLLNYKINEVYDFKPPQPIIGGPANAAYLLVQLVTGIEKFFVYRKKEKQHGITGAIDGWAVQEGDRVILVEDVITTGQSLLPSIKYVEECGGELLAIIPVIDRNESDILGKYRILVRPIYVKEDFLY